MLFDDDFNELVEDGFADKELSGGDFSGESREKNFDKDLGSNKSFSGNNFSDIDFHSNNKEFSKDQNEVFPEGEVSATSTFGEDFLSNKVSSEKGFPTQKDNVVDINEFKMLKMKTEKMEKELESQKDLYLRLAAEYDNYRKRTERDRLLIYGDATANAILNILPIADSLDAALKSFSDAPAEYKKGMDLLAGQLKASFEKLEIKSFGNVGELFNPQEHEAIQHIEDDSLGENVVVEVLRKGYKYKDKIIRYAMVRVAN